MMGREGSLAGAGMGRLKDCLLGFEKIAIANGPKTAIVEQIEATNLSIAGALFLQDCRNLDLFLLDAV